MCVLVLSMSNATAACRAKDASQIAAALTRGIALNERFKRSVKAGDHARYQDLRKQVERYDEETAMPCVRKALQFLERESDEALVRKLMDFTVSYENSADETVSEAMATIFAKRPDAVACVASSTSGQKGLAEMRDFDLRGCSIYAYAALAQRTS